MSTFFCFHYCVYVNPSLFLNTEVMRATQQRVAHPATPAGRLAPLGLSRPRLCKHSSSDLLLVVLRQKAALVCLSPLIPARIPMSHCLWSLSLSPSCVCGACCF